MRARGIGAALLLVAGAASTSGCASHPRPVPVQVGNDPSREAIPGLDVCDRKSAGFLHLDPSRPLTLFVHGCHDSGGRFRELAEVFEAHGQQTACFNYDHRDSLEESSRELAVALDSLEKRLPAGRITVLAHSQGGLVARRALIQERHDAPLPESGFTYRLFTVSAPFGGIRSSADCGKTWLHVLSLGVTVGVCNIIAGRNWSEIPPGSAFMTRPGTLRPEVKEVLKVVTSERGACLTRSADGKCKPDYVFSVDEQTNAAVDQDARLDAVTVQAGHVEIVGGDGRVPEKLIALLQARGILQETPPEKREAVALLLKQLFESPAPSW